MFNKKLLHRLRTLISMGLVGLLCSVFVFPSSFAAAQDAEPAQDLSDNILQEDQDALVVVQAEDADDNGVVIITPPPSEDTDDNGVVVITPPPPSPQHEGLDFEVIARGGTAFSLYTAGTDFPETLLTATDGFGFNGGGSARLMFNHPAYTVAGINNGAYLSTGIELYFDYTRIWSEVDTRHVAFESRTDYMHLMGGLATSITVNTSPDEVTRFGSSALLGACGRDTLVTKVDYAPGGINKDPKDDWGPCLGMNLWLLQSLSIFVFGTELGFNATYFDEIEGNSSASGVFFLTQLNLLAGLSF